MAELQTSPDHDNEGWPPGVPYIVGNEACERFSYYGMKAILYMHLTGLLLLGGFAQEYAQAAAISRVHLFNAAVYAVPMVGGILADRYWGKYKTILWLSMMYCVGHGLLALADIPDDPMTRLYIVYAGLGCIALGAGGIKPCVSANVGDQFGKKNWFRIRTMYQIFYFSINFGSVFATLMIPAIRGDGSESWRVSLAFGVPGILMAIATVFFWRGRKKFVHVPPSPGGRLGKLDVLSGSLMFMAVGHVFFTQASVPAWGMVLVSIFFLAVGLVVFNHRQSIAQDDGFLAILIYTVRANMGGSDKAGAVGGASSSAGVPGADDDDPAKADISESPIKDSKFWKPAIDRFGLTAAEGPSAVLKVLTIFAFIPIFWAIFEQHSSTWIEQAKHLDRNLFGIEFLPSQVPFLNPALVMILIPVMNVVYRLIEKSGFSMMPLRRMYLGIFVAGASFVIAALIEEAIEAQGPGVVWVGWQLLAYIVLTTSEVMVSITSLEFAYTQAPKRMKSAVMGLYLFTVTAGNFIVAWVVGGLKIDPGSPKFFWIFAIAAFVIGALLAVRSKFYIQRDYPQD